MELLEGKVSRSLRVIAEQDQRLILSLKTSPFYSALLTLCTVALDLINRLQHRMRAMLFPLRVRALLIMS